MQRSQGERLDDQCDQREEGSGGVCSSVDGKSRDLHVDDHTQIGLQLRLRRVQREVQFVETSMSSRIERVLNRGGREERGGDEIRGGGERGGGGG
jgi:hypothetical protein